jgi:arsenate reductase-like glutaredoxin family protein
VGGIDNLIDWDGKSQEITNMKYMDDKVAKEDKVFDDPALMRTPIVRNGKQATVGFCPEVWEKWE